MLSQQNEMSFFQIKLLESQHKHEFIELVHTRDEDKCIEYIKKYNDFYNAIVGGYTGLNILQYVCSYNLNRVAMALIDQNCNLTYQNSCGSTAMMYASCNKLNDVVTHIIDKSMDIKTRTAYGVSEMMYICDQWDVENTIKMIDRGYDIYLKDGTNRTLFTRAIIRNLKKVVMKLIDIDTNFIDEFNISYRNSGHIKDEFYRDIIKYCADKRASYKDTIIATMDDASPTNALYNSFHTTYAVGLVDVICDFIIL
ncbi:MAG: hypothetical protein Faunusvirus25_9 [Faunusvirus sp.]|jgi:ankyrin repeat protein|uniref:Uncharacterized protein n=1 Tax=Faunusvirus sp. TaxID=2487766 RepID=A0A3G5A001_9VIRU|nr:MAG: hypothetical protein Faunusvirus25_9 [Faunusvirus sp.]